MMQLTLDELKELVAAQSGKPTGNSCSFRVGTAYLIRSVTMFYTGRITAITDTDLVLEDAAWIADTGRFHDALKTGTLNEVEPFVAPVIVPRGVIVDATEWTFGLPRAQK
jgi:hypothetical protein